MIKSALVAGLTLLAACSSSTESGGPSCKEISGNYSVTDTRLSGDCDTTLDPKGPSTWSMRVGANGGWEYVGPGLEGGCPGTLNEVSCKFTATCRLFDPKTNATAATFNLDYQFTATGYTGTVVSGLVPPTVATRCEVTYRETGTKL